MVNYDTIPSACADAFAATTRHLRMPRTPL
jgi:hypothetical protein